MATIIEVQGVSKQYYYGHSTEQVGSARELLVSALKAPFQKRTAATPRQDAFFWALRDINFNVAEGEIVGIIGANGAGKSTLLKILSRITDPTSGKVRLRGRMASLLEVGTGFHPELTGRENIFMNGAILGMRNSEIKDRFDEIVAFAEIEKFLDTPVKHYSSGMNVRLGFAVAAHLQPEILIVDEVLAVGDMAFQKKCLGKMSDVSKSGRTVLFVSHNMAAVENLCERGIVLEHGRVVFDGVTKGAIGQYLAIATRPEDGDGHEIDLSEAATRKPHHKSIIKKIEMFTDDDQPAPRAIQMGKRLRVKIHMCLPNVVPGFKFGLGFNSVFGQRVLTLHTSFEPNLDSRMISGDSILECDVPSLTLVPGEYFVFPFVDFGGERKDAIPEAFTISVLDRDYYGTGKAPFTGIFVLPQRWSMEPVCEPSLTGAGR